MSEWNNLTPIMRMTIGGQADKQTWTKLSNARKQELINQAKKTIEQKRNSGQIITVTETPAQRKIRRNKPKLTAQERIKKMKEENKASRGMIEKKKKKKDTLTDRQKKTMQRHAEHHTKKHMTEMRKLMLKGKTFTQAHKIAMKKVGR